MSNTIKRIACSLLTVLILIPITARNTFAAVTYTYDPNGNMTSDGQLCYGYNDANQLSNVKKCSNSQLVAEYLYNHEGKRIVKKEYENGTLKQTIYSPDSEYETKKLANGTIQNTSYYYANDELVAKKNPDNSKNYFLNDHLGSTSTLTNQSGAVVEENSYYPFGEVRTGGLQSKYQFTGQEKDVNTGLNYYGARYYNSHIQRFIQPDSILPNSYDPQQLNRYSYVRNNPLKYTDPSGHCIWDFCMLEMAIAFPVVAPAVALIATHPEIVETGLGTALSAGASISSFKNKDYISGAIYGSLAALGVGSIRQTVFPGLETGSKIGNFAEEYSIKGPNPNGKKGSPNHQGPTQLTKETLENQGLKVQTEVPIKIPEGGYKSLRYADLMVTNEQNQSWPVQIGRANKNGLPVSRELKALSDLKRAGWVIYDFIPYKTGK